MFDGRFGVTVPVGADVADVEPPELAAVTITETVQVLARRPTGAAGRNVAKVSNEGSLLHPARERPRKTTIPPLPTTASQ